MIAGRMLCPMTLAVLSCCSHSRRWRKNYEVSEKMPQLPTELINSIGVALQLFVAVLTATLVAFWVSLAIWTFRDMRARTHDIFAWVLATLLVIVTGPFGLLLYVLLRPRETLAEAYDRQLEEEALLRDISARRACPTCQSVTEPDWLLCPHCRTELRRSCRNCAKPLDLDWVTCPYCATDVQAPTNVMPAYRQPEFAPVQAAAPTYQGPEQ
jgi:RNA polymerase subunit RPABC4/transcription elongation factor Spt4